MALILNIHVVRLENMLMAETILQTEKNGSDIHIKLIRIKNTPLEHSLTVEW